MILRPCVPLLHGPYEDAAVAAALKKISLMQHHVIQNLSPPKYSQVIYARFHKCNN